MKKLFILGLLLSLLYGIGSTAQTSPQCRIISIDHFGGNSSDGTYDRFYIPNDDGTFNIIIGTVSTESISMDLSCLATEPSGAIVRHYNADYTALLDQYCFKAPTDSIRTSPFTYLQDSFTIRIGQSLLNSQDFAFELRDANDSVIYTKLYGSSGFERFRSTAATPDGGYVLVGEAHGNDGDVGMHYGDYFAPDAWLVKVDSMGTILWSRVFGGTGEDKVSDVYIADDGSIYLLGSSFSTDDDFLDAGNHGELDLYVAKFSADGLPVWVKCYGGGNSDGTYDGANDRAIPDGNGGYYIATNTSSIDGDVAARAAMGYSDYWLLHIDSVGTLLWEHSYGGSGGEYILSFCRATDGSLWGGGAIPLN